MTSVLKSDIKKSVPISTSAAEKVSIRVDFSDSPSERAEAEGRIRVAFTSTQNGNCNIQPHLLPAGHTGDVDSYRYLCS